MSSVATSKSFEIESFFLAGPTVSLFCLHLFPRLVSPRGLILYLHPFGEEMNKSRRTVALQARQFAAAGYAVLQPDLTGCGDSFGELDDADWRIWLQDTQAASDWLRQRWERETIMLWGLRLGGALAAAFCETSANVQQLLLWHPLINGEQILNQLLRIELARDMLGKRKNLIGLRELRYRLEQSETLEVIGYPVTPQFAASIAQVNLEKVIPRVPVTLIDVVSDGESTIRPGSQILVARWQQQSVQVKSAVARCPPFWATQEICECHPIIEMTLELLREAPDFK